MIDTPSDSTSRRLAEEALKKERDFSAAIIDTVDSLILVLDLHGRIVRFNRACERTTGYTSQDMCGRFIWDVVPPNQVEPTKAAFTPFIISNWVRIYEQALMTHTGELRLIDWSTTLMFDDNEQPEYMICTGSDITQQRQVEQALRASEQRFRTLATHAPVGIFQTDIRGNCIFVNERWLALAGISEEEALSDGWVHALHPDDRVRTVEEWKTAALGGSEFAAEYRFVWPDGTTIWVSGSAVAVRDSVNDVTGYIGTVVDITPWKQADAALRETEARYRTLIEQLPAIIYTAVLDEHSGTSYVSPQIEQILGFTPEEWLADPNLWLKQVHPEDRAVVLDEVEHTQADNESHTSEYRAISRNGRIVWLRDTARVVRDLDGLPLFLQGITLDITESKRAEVMSARLAAIVDSSDDTIIGVAMDRTITSWNAGAERMCGYNAHEMIGQPISLLVPLELRAEREELYSRLERGEQISHNEDMWQCKDGQIIDVMLTISAIRSGNDISGFSVIARDITEYKQTGTMLELTRDQALESSRLKSEFLATMSHEIRTPMNGIIGMTELLLDTPLASDQYEFATTVRDSAQALLTIIDDILDFSKVEAGKLNLEIAEFALLPTVEGVGSLLAGRAHTKGLTLTTYVAPEVPLHLSGDSGRLRQVLLNLVGNAVKFTEQGEVEVRAELERVVNSHAVVRFAVRDTGPGIPSAARQRLFQPFIQADGSVTRKYGGTGLGLAISKRLVELMGGEIGVESIEGQGTTFWFTARFGLEASSAAPQLPSLRVLVVDTNRTHQDLVLRYLHGWQMHADAAVDGDDALRRLRRTASTPYELVIVAQGVPQLEPLVEAVQERTHLTGTQLILLTPFGDRNQHQSTLQAGFAACLTMPVKQSELFNAITAATNPSVTDSVINAASTPAGASAEMRLHGRVLLVEDHPTNQRLARLQLEKLGCSVQLASDGREAIAAVCRDDASFDLVLMDCQMPEIDGYAATRAIRAWERLNGGHMPIIAMTAHAMQGDLEECLAAGMDDYLSKPVRRDTLYQTLIDRLSTDSLVSEQSVTANVILDPTMFEEFREITTGAGPGAFCELIDMFLEDGKEQLAALEQAVACVDASATFQAAHRLKGGSGNIGALDLMEAATRLEELGQAGSLKGAEALIQRVTAAFAQVEQALVVEKSKDEGG